MAQRFGVNEALVFPQGGAIVGLELYPIELGHAAPRSQRGTPRLADEATARRIGERLARLSAPFGTTIVYENGIGLWRSGRVQWNAIGPLMPTEHGVRSAGCEDQIRRAR